MESSQEGMQVKLESPAEKPSRQHVLILEHLLEGAELQWKEANNELEHVPAEEKMTRDGRSSAFLASKMELVRSKAKLECLVERMKSVKDEGKLESQRWKMRLSKNIEKAEFALQEMKWMPGEEGVEALGLDIMQVEEQIAKSKLLLEEVELIRHEKEEKFPLELYFQKKMESPMLTMQLNEHMVKVESLLENMKEESKIESPMLRIQFKEDKLELESLLNQMKFVLKLGKVWFSTFALSMQFEIHIMKLKLLLDGTELEEEKERLGSEMLKKPSSGELIAKSEFFPKQGEKEGLESEMLEKPLSGELVTKAKFFPKQGEKGLGSEMLEKPLSGEVIAKSEFFPKQAEEEGLGSQMFEKALSEKLRKRSDFFLRQREEKRLGSQFFTKTGLKFEHLQKISSTLRKIESVHDESDLKSPALGMRFKEPIVELEGELKKMELENVKEKLKFRKLKITSYSQRVELDRLQEKIKIELKEGLQSQALKIELNEDITKLALEETELEEIYVAELKRFIAKAKEINLVREERTMESLMLQLKKRTVELKSLLEEMKLMQWFDDTTWYVNWETYVGELESLLKGMELKQMRQGLPSQVFEIQLNEHVVKLEMLVKEMESTRDVNALELKEHLGELKSPLEATKLVQDEVKLEFSALEMQLKEQIENQRETESIKWSLIKQWRKHTVELTSLHEKIKFVQLAGELECQPLEMELNRHERELESLVDEMSRGGRIPMSEEKFQRESKSLLKKIESKRDVEILSILMLKMELEGHSAKWRYLIDELMKLEKERKLMSTTLRNEFKQHIAKLKFLIVEMKLEQKEKTVGSGALQIELKEHIVKSELLLEIRELICDADILKSTMSGIQFKGRLREAVEFHLRIIDLELGENNPKFSALQGAIVALNFLLEKMKSKEKEVKLQSSTMKLEHEEGKLESSAQGRKLTPREQKATSPLMAQQKGVKLESSTVHVKLEGYIVKLEALLRKMKLEPKEEKLEPSPKRIRLEQEEGKMESSTPREQKAASPLIAQRPIIIIGGRGQDGQSLSSVEGYIFLEGRWIELPAMNTPRSFMSSVVVGNEIVVSGGDTGPVITDTIEVLNLAETPLQWKISRARLPVPLSAHQTVVYDGKLIVIGGHDFDEGRNSDKIYEVLLTPPYTSRILRTLVTPVAWHGAELVGHEIFIFGGGRTPAVPSSAVFSYSPGSDRLHDKQPLPTAVMGMATASKGRRIAVIGGLDHNEQELSEVFTYPIREGELHALPQMNERRGGCSAVISLTLERGGSRSSERFTDALFALGSVRSINTVEGYSFESHRWIDMPPMREPRGFCSMVVAPIEFQYE